MVLGCVCVCVCVFTYLRNHEYEYEYEVGLVGSPSRGYLEDFYDYLGYDFQARFSHRYTGRCRNPYQEEIDN